MTGLRVAVVGGGLAGITAALECADRGADVSLFEARRVLGGATFSFDRSGLRLDNGQHIALRCCSSYRSLLARLGVADRLAIQPRLSVPVLSTRRAARLRRTSLPAPLHLGASLLSYGHLSPRDRLVAARAVLALRSLDLRDERLDGLAFGAWLRAHGQSERAIENLWNLIALPTLNLPAEEASLALAAFVFRTGLLDHSDACDLAVPTVSLRELHGDPALSALRAAGVDVRRQTRVEGIASGPQGFEVRASGVTAAFDRVVCALPPGPAADVLPPGVLASDIAERLGTSPIVNVHLWFDRRVLAEPVVAALGTTVQWVFDRTAASGADRGQLLAVSISSATEEIGRPQAELIDACVSDLRNLVPQARAAQLLRGIVTREPSATFRAAPGTARHRPPAGTAVPGLALAGAWTDTGWPATMEGAVRSGIAAAAAALGTARPAKRAPALEVAA